VQRTLLQKDCAETPSFPDLRAKGAGGVTKARPTLQRASSGAIPTPALQSLVIKPIPIRSAKSLLERNHYLRSLPGNTQLAFGVFVGSRLSGVLTLGAGSANGYRMMSGAGPRDCVTLTRLWLSDDLPNNSESRFIGVVLRALSKYTNLKFILSYADPVQGHLGNVYQASNWIYIGLSSSTPLYDMGDGKLHHSRSLAHAYGTHSIRFFAEHGVVVQLVGQEPKHRYIYLLDPSWRDRLVTPVLPYPKRQGEFRQ